MSHYSIKDILALPPKTNIADVQGLVVDVFKHRTTAAGKHVQDAVIRDASGAQIDFSVWGHEDISPLKGKEVFINAGQKGKISVEFDTYNNRNRNRLSVSSTCTFQLLHVHQAQTGSPTPETQPQTAANGPAQNQKYVDPRAEGSRQGMCFKLAGDYYIARMQAGEPLDPSQFSLAVGALCMMLVESAKNAESGQPF